MLNILSGFVCNNRFSGNIFYQNFFQASKYIPDICVIRAVQKIVWASGCGTVQLVFSSNEEISKIYEKVNAQSPSEYSTFFYLLNVEYTFNVTIPVSTNCKPEQ